MAAFQEDDIRELADYRSFERGEDYYKSGSVSKITKTGDHYEGYVNGTLRYKVSLDIIGDRLGFSCSCPYENWGICKHSVAFGLAILGHDFPDEVLTEPQPKGDFVKIYREADLQKKLDFLNQLLNKDSDLQSQFIAFVSTPFKNLDDIAGINIEKIKSEVFKKISSIDFDSAVENYHGSYDGYYDDEGSYDAAYSLIEDVIETYLEKAGEFLRKGNLLDAFRILFGAYEGSQCLPEPNDEYCLFEDGFNEKVFELLSHSIKDFAPKVESIVKHNETVFLIVDLFFERYSKYELDNSNDEMSINYDMKLFENVLISLITDSETAGYLYKKIQEHDLENLSSAYIVLKIAELTSNSPLWFETAETFAVFDSKITQQLIEKYKRGKQADNFNRIARFAFEKWPGSFDAYLIDNIDKVDQKELYISALRHYTKENRNIEYYKELRKLLNEGALNTFIGGIASGYNYEFYVQVLEIEERYEEILAVAMKNKDSWSFDKLIKPIINIYPNECFNLIVEKCNGAMKSHNRNRDTYQTMVKWMKLQQQITTRHAESKQFFQSLFNSKPNLPALKDEMKKGGLI